MQLPTVIFQFGKWRKNNDLYFSFSTVDHLKLMSLEFSYKWRMHYSSYARKECKTNINFKQNVLHKSASKYEACFITLIFSHLWFII